MSVKRSFRIVLLVSLFSLLDGFFVVGDGFAFDKGEEISSHASRGDAFVTVLEGKGKFCIDGIPYVLNKGESIVMPANIPHSVFGEEQFKMLLVVLFLADSAKVEGKPIIPS